MMSLAPDVAGVRKRMLNHADSRLHWSDLREIRKSPAHYAYAVQHPRTEITREMRVGAATDALVFGVRKLAVFEGKVRNGKEWEAFKAEHAGEEIVNESEMAEAQGAATALLEDPDALSWLKGERQVVLQWDMLGIPCATGIAGKRGGIDVLDRGFGRLVDLKSTSSTDPEPFSSHAWNMDWHTQLKFYKYGCAANGIEIRDLALVGIESSPPYIVEVLEIPSDVEEEADKRLRMMLERLKGCLDADRWPKYVQGPVPMSLPRWMRAEVD
jgi:hypothetical protein